jgi:hypothetical protein
MIDADKICSEYYYWILFKKGKIVSRNHSYSNIKNKHKKKWSDFEKLAEICNKYKIDYKEYIKFVINHAKVFIVPSELLKIKWFSLYNEHIKIKNQYKKIYDLTCKTSEYIADQCVKHNINSSKDFIKILIKNDKLSPYISTGRISKYWIVSFKREQLQTIVEKSTQVNKEVLYKILKNQQIYYDEMQEAFKLFTGKMYKPIFYTDKLIEKKIKTT